MKCPECLATDSFEEVLSDWAELHQCQPVVLRNVPVRRCCQCGYKLISADRMGRIEQALASGQPTATIAAAVYDLAAVLSDVP
jgi:YgiT-type zinc finger domain-containing protein